MTLHTNIYFISVEFVNNMVQNNLTFSGSLVTLELCIMSGVTCDYGI